MVVGAINIIVGGAILFYSYEMNVRLTSSLANINGSLSSSLAILSNVTALASSTSTNIHILSQNMSNVLSNFSMNLYAIQQNFNQEAGFFYNWSVLGYRPQTTQEIGNTFQTLSTQIGSINSKDIPTMLHLVNTETSNVAAPLSNITQEMTLLKYNLFTLLSTYKTDISQIQFILTFGFVGFGIYTILQGILFITLGKISSYLINKSKIQEIK